MSDAMRIVPESELSPEELAYARERDLLRRAGDSYAGNNRMTLEQMRRLVAEGDQLKAVADAYTAQQKRLREDEKRLAEQEAALAKEQAGRDAEAALKAQYLKAWPYSTALFEAQWKDILADHVRAEARRAAEALSDEAFKARKLASGQYDGPD